MVDSLLSTALEHKNFRVLRHRWEMPLVWTSGIVSLLAIAFALMVATMTEETAAELFGDSAQDVADFALPALAALVVPLLIFVYRFYMAARAKANAIRVGPQQFPELWRMYQELAGKLELSPLPRLYVVNGNGVVNAYALSCNRRAKYIVLHAEVVLAIDERPEIVEFVLAHEMAHHKLGHVSLWRLALGTIPGMLAPLGISTIRAQEYSADRVAHALCNHHHQAMGVLAAGLWLEHRIDPGVWLAQCEAERKEWFVRAVNIMSDHAVMSKRYKALCDIDKEGFGCHGDMF